MSDALYLQITRVVTWLNIHNGCELPELTMRILKLQEESGEVASAWIGLMGQNPRKGVTHTQVDVLNELRDVIGTALVALRSLGRDPGEEMNRLARDIKSRLDQEIGVQ